MATYPRVLQCLALPLLLLVAGCGDQELYGKLKENQANEMIAVLRNASIETSKKEGKEGEWSIAVAPDKFARAVEVLRAAGYPKDEFATLGEIFQKKGFVSSPIEERARLIYGLSQELSSTVSRIDGVVEARVHLAIPEPDPLSDKIKPSSAAVFIKYQPGFELRSQTGAIKSLVTNSIEGLSYDKVSVVMFPSQAAPQPQELSIAGFGQSFLAVLLAALGLVGLGVALVMRGRRRVPAVPQAAE